MSSGAVAVVGACNVDLISYVPRLPVEGETLKGTSFEQGFGGKGANQAVQARLLGADTIFISKLGGLLWCLSVDVVVTVYRGFLWKAIPR